MRYDTVDKLHYILKETQNTRAHKHGSTLKRGQGRNLSEN